MNTADKAQEFVDSIVPKGQGLLRVVALGAYLQGAKDQNDSDINKVCELMTTMLNDGTIETGDIGKVNTIILETLKQ